MIHDEFKHEPDTTELRRYYRHQDCLYTDCWVVEKWTTIYARRKRDHALIDMGEKWRPLSATPKPFKDRAAAMNVFRVTFDIALLRVVNIHTGDWIMACLL